MEVVGRKFMYVSDSRSPDEDDKTFFTKGQLYTILEVDEEEEQVTLEDDEYLDNPKSGAHYWSGLVTFLQSFKEVS
jgi:hypothetical protein